MKRLAFCLILAVLTAYVAPALWMHLSRVPHQHILIGNVTAADMEAHLAAERGELDLPPNTLAFRAGFILSVPFGDWAEFLSNLGMCFFVAVLIRRGLTFSARVWIDFPGSLALFPALPDPPPRFA